MIFLNAIKPVLRDFLSTIVFVALIWITDDAVLATALGVGTGVMQTVWMLARKAPIGPLQWISLGLVTVLGSITIFTGNALFFKLKSSIAALAIGTVMLRRSWLMPYLPPFITETLDERTIIRAARAWAALMGVIALSNLAVAYFCSNRVWAAFIFTVPALSYFALLGAQYAIFGKRIRDNIRARNGADA
jgi:intracellular septation protein